MFGGSTEELAKSQKLIRWVDTQNNALPKLPCDGVPFIIMGTREMMCQIGHRRQKREVFKPILFLYTYS